MEAKEISKETHKKHGGLARPEIGKFHRVEWAVLGAPCGEIRKLCSGIVAALHSSAKIGYVDADHKGEALEVAAQSILSQGASIELTDKIDFFRVDRSGQPSDIDLRNVVSSLDAVLVNGNHFLASRQIVIIDPRKDLAKKLDRLTNVKLLILSSDQAEIPAVVKDKIPHGTPAFHIDEIRSIADWLLEQIQTSVPPIQALVLAGGESSRMKSDKGLIFYHGLPQREFLYQLLESSGLAPHLSIRQSQQSSAPDTMKAIPDTFLGLGPYGGILSAFQHNPNVAWLTIACDLPLLEEKHLQQLVKNRNPSKIATAFFNPDTQFPEPLITLWEPKAYPVLLQFLSQGMSCPRKVLINSEIELVKPDDTAFMMNANTPEDRDKAQVLLTSR